MADSTLDSELFVLKDYWPGYPSRSGGYLPQGGWTGATHNVVAAAAHIGEKVQVRNDPAVAGVAGLSTFVYLQVGTQDTGTAIAAKTFCVPDSATLWYQVTNDADSCIVHTGSALLAVAISAMTDAYFGWFWCGGVCPESHVSALGGTYATEGNVVAGALVAHKGATDTDAVILGPCGADTEAIIGMALAADAV